MSRRAMLPWPLVLPLVVLASPAAALDWPAPDFRDRDKRQHAIAGAAIGATATAVAGLIVPRSTWWTRALIGVAAAAVAGAAKEAMDARTHDADPEDTVATIGGGVAGALTIALVWRF